MTDRASYIGGSDIAAIMGISPWRTAWDVWAEKTQDPSWQPQDETPMMRWGTLLEPIILDEYERQQKAMAEDGRFHIEARQVPVSHRTYAYLKGHIDATCLDIDAIPAGIVEAKTAHSAKDWGTIEEPVIPEHYQAQCYFYLALTGAPWCDVAVLLPRGDFRIIRLDADEKVQRGIIAAAVAFWEDHVIPRKPPPMDASPAASRWLARMPDDDEDVLEAGAELEEIIEKLSGVRTALDGLESSKALLENQAKAIIGEHQKAVGRGWHVTYRRNKPFPVTKWKEAAAELRIEMQMHGLADEADRAIGRHTKMEENRRPFVLKSEVEE